MKYKCFYCYKNIEFAEGYKNGVNDDPLCCNTCYAKTQEERDKILTARLDRDYPNRLIK